MDTASNWVMTMPSDNDGHKTHIHLVSNLYQYCRLEHLPLILNEGKCRLKLKCPIEYPDVYDSMASFDKDEAKIGKQSFIAAWQIYEVRKHLVTKLCEQRLSRIERELLNEINEAGLAIGRQGRLVLRDIDKRFLNKCESMFFRLEDLGLVEPIDIPSNLAVIQELVRGFRASCFCEDNLSAPMWYHYGGNYAGACMEFKTASLANWDPNVISLIKPVHYRKERPELDLKLIYEFVSAKHLMPDWEVEIPQEARDQILSMLSSKYKDWAFEKEHRLILGSEFHHHKYDNEKELLELPLPSAIYFGPKARDEEILDKVEKVELLRKIPLYKIIIREDERRLDYTEYPIRKE